MSAEQLVMAIMSHSFLSLFAINLPLQKLNFYKEGEGLRQYKAFKVSLFQFIATNSFSKNKVKINFFSLGLRSTTSPSFQI